eukprot:6423288-Prymnesium_polylepis.1
MLPAVRCNAWTWRVRCCEARRIGRRRLHLPARVFRPLYIELRRTTAPKGNTAQTAELPYKAVRQTNACGPVMSSGCCEEPR